VFTALPHSLVLHVQEFTIKKNSGRQAFTVKIKPNCCFLPFFISFSAFVPSPFLKMDQITRSHLKNAKWPDLYASCCSAEIVFQLEISFQQNSLDEFPTSGREFITALNRNPQNM
jgi:hypothetical protein